MKRFKSGTFVSHIPSQVVVSVTFLFSLKTKGYGAVIGNYGGVVLIGYSCVSWWLFVQYDEAERRREMAKNSLERYTHYYERWATNESVSAGGSYRFLAVSFALAV